MPEESPFSLPARLCIKKMPIPIFLLLLLSLSFPSNPVSVATKPVLLNCGSSSVEQDADGRKWIGDLSPNASAAGVIPANQTTPSAASFQDPSLPSSVPYMTATVFRSEASYQFFVTPKTRHLIRFYFYPESYCGLDPKNGSFDLSASGGLTLLRNFSAYITAQALSQGYIVREFLLPPAEDSFLVFTFKPSWAGAFGFVNGIELSSMPDIFPGAAAMVGFSDSSVSAGSSAAQTMYRLNVGGQYIPPTNDTELSRAWYDDTPYIAGSGVGVTAEAGPRVRIQYPESLPDYIAPSNVYRTARQMGPDPKVNIQYNLSWSFQIDPNFTYIVRLHFCEIQLSKANQRVFDIFINNQMAQRGVDVVAMASSMAVPLYKDYAVYVGDGDHLLVELHPSRDGEPEFYDAILNGMEAFKLSDSGGNLAGPNPKPSEKLEEDLRATAAREFELESGGRTQVIKKAVLAAVALFLASTVFVYQMKKKRAPAQEGSAADGSGWLPLHGNSHTTGSKSCASSHLSAMAAGLCRHFAISEIREGTRNFDEELVIGVGGFGKVYKGMIDGGSTKVAVKRSNPDSEQGINEFQTEIEMLSKLRHKHLVSLIGYCEEGGEMCLVYDYMAYGTLREHLYKTNKPPLPWKQRLEICIGSARGLHYLHTGAKYTIIHRDVKTTNILLDENWVAKVSDFGLSKTGPSMNQSHVSTVVKGSFGYLDPEYFRRQQLTEKSDVYSFGVVLFEVLCARPALNPALPKDQVSLADWALQNQRKGALLDIVDPLLRGRISPECLSKFAGTAEKCLSERGPDRPSMGDVLWNLEFALQLQQGFEAVHAGAEPFNELLEVSTGGEGVADIQIEQRNDSKKSDEMVDSSIFSLLVNPKGR